MLDPASFVSAAAQRLPDQVNDTRSGLATSESLPATRVNGPSEFEVHLSSVINSQEGRESQPPPTISTRAEADSAAIAQIKLDAYLMQNVVEQILPPETSGLFGDGTAGELWRSLLVEQLARVVVSDDRIMLIQNWSRSK